MKSLVLLVLLVLPVAAEWPRLVITPKGRFVDSPKSYPLAYFTELPMLREESGSFCYLCSPEKRVAEAKKSKAKAEVRFVGKFGTYSAFDVFYHDTGDPIPTWKSILIQTGPDSYQEIYHDQPNEGEAKPSFVLEARQERYLCVLDNVYRYDSEEHCFWLGPEGVVKIDFSPVWEAARKASPKGWDIWEYGIHAGQTLQAQQMLVGFRSKLNGRCCEEGVGVDVGFTLKRGIVTVTRTQLTR